MRSSFVATLLFFVALPLASVFAQHHHHHHRSTSSTCGCGAPVPAAPACNTCNAPAPAPCATCNTAPAPCAACATCNACNVGGACGGVGGCGSCGGGLCSNPALFYETLYAEFYARNSWYLEHKQRESAARRARLYGQDPDAATPPVKSPGPITAPASKPAVNKVAEPVQAPEPKSESDRK